MAEILKGQELEEKLKGREPLTGSIKLRERDSESEAVYDDFEIEGVLNAGGSCICYKAIRFFENSEMAETGTLKELYPVDSQSDSSLSYNLKRYDIDAGILAKQLYSEESTLANFINVQNEFYECYKKITDVKLDNEINDNFFAPIHIYRGIPADKGSKNYTIYIWNPGDSSLKSFDDHLKEMQKRINDEIDSPQGDLSLSLSYELHTILQTIKALAIGIQNLHYENLLHLDIKPSNFGIRNLGENKGDNISVSLFDVNTIYSRSNPLARTGGTPYFRAPEMIGDVFNNYNHIPVGCLSDIYSLGATLYNSIIISSGERGLYEPSLFSEIDTELSHSLLMEYSEYNSKAELYDALSNILKRALARNATDYFHGVENYISVGEFIEDISKADKIVNQEIGKAIKAGSTNTASFSITNKEDYYDSKIDGGAVSSMQCLLYDYPLYNYVDNGKLNVLVLGAGVFGQKFIDIAFELSQIKDCYLNITVVSNEKEKDQTRYLNSRPEVKNYFWVNGEEPKYNQYGAYGSIEFIDINSDYGKEFLLESEHNIDILLDSLNLSDEKYGYVFISMSDEQLNRKLACDLSEADIILSEKSIVNFVTYKDLTQEKKREKEYGKKGRKYRLFNTAYDNCAEKASENNIELNPVFIKNTLINHKDFRFLSRMAFNCHLLWGDGLNVDINKSYGNFRSAYNYTSSFANALSIKYKLHSCGIELSDITTEKNRIERERKLKKVTQQYREKIGIGVKKSENQKKCLNELTMYEHRRWVVNMICSSSYEELPKDEYNNLRNTNKDKRNRKHSCIVPSTEDWALNKGDWKTKLSKWDEDDIEETADFQKLDPLDKMSIMLHRHFMNLSKEFNIDSIENDAGIVRRYLCNNPEALAAFNAYIIAMRAIISRKTRNDTAQETFNHCTETFFKYLKNAELANAEELKKRVKNIEDAFAPVKMAYDFTDYKAKDQRLVNNIPFILNYSTAVRLCIPFVKGKSNNEWFENVASSIVINPSMVTYLIDIDDPQKIISTIKDNLSNITRVMDGHSLQTRISLILYVKAKEGIIEEAKKSEIEKKLKEISPRIYSIDIVEIKNQKELVSRIKKTFETNQKSSSRFSAIEIKDEFISGTIYSIEELSVPTYEFSSMKKTFRMEEAEDEYIWFSDIPFNPHLNIEDMFLAQGKLSVYQEPELHKDYKMIWDNCYYDKNAYKCACKSQGWKSLCASIKKKMEADSLLAEIKINQNIQDKNQSTKLFVPAFCKAAIEKVMDSLSSPGIDLLDEANINEHNSVMLEVSFVSSQTVRDAIFSMFANPYNLIDESQVKLISNGKYIKIYVDSLVVNDFSWDLLKAEPQFGTSLQEAKSAFNYLVENGYIIKFIKSNKQDEADEPDNKKISFCFASNKIKKLLSNEGQLLEIYTYYKTIEQGYFDEIRTSLEVNRKKDTGEYLPTQEFDLVAVKGFRSQFVEIKARNNLQQDFYQKLKANGDKFGINKELVLVAHIGNNTDNSENNEFIKRGQEDYNVETAINITNIGTELVNKMKKDSK